MPHRNPRMRPTPPKSSANSECSIYGDSLNIEAKGTDVVEQYGASHLAGDDGAQEQSYSEPRREKSSSDQEGNGQQSSEGKVGRDASHRQGQRYCEECAGDGEYPPPLEWHREMESALLQGLASEKNNHAEQACQH